ncbi:MAG: hypothetical protein NVS9B14_21580 [Candidatus Acidiferrum sp.]
MSASEAAVKAANFLLDEEVLDRMRLAEALDKFVRVQVLRGRLDEAEDMPHEKGCRSRLPEELENAENCDCYRSRRTADLQAQIKEAEGA